MPKLFPSGIAYGMAFYDRSNERKSLKKAIDNNIHTTLTAPRRFGKTSLMRKVIEENKYPFVWIDMMAFTSREQAEEQILQHVAQSVVKIGGTEERIKQLAKKFLSYLKPEIVASVVNTVSLKLSLAKPENKPVDFITTLLINLDSIAQAANQRVVFVFDEFQEIIHLEHGDNNAFQGSIRHAVEQSQNVTYVFSGSKQEALRSLFTGKKSPLYELCRLFPLSLIPENFYKKYLKEVSAHRWSRDIGGVIIDRILHHSACYPKYVNAICQALWVSEEEPTVELIDKLWEDFMFTRKSSIRDELESLKMSDRKLFRCICFYPVIEPTSLEYSKISNVPTTTASRSIKTLKEKDFVYRDSEGLYRAIDPTYLAYFKLFG